MAAWRRAVIRPAWRLASKRRRHENTACGGKWRSENAAAWRLASHVKRRLAKRLLPGVNTVKARRRNHRIKPAKYRLAAGSNRRRKAARNEGSEISSGVMAMAASLYAKSVWRTGIENNRNASESGSRRPSGGWRHGETQRRNENGEKRRGAISAVISAA